MGIDRKPSLWNVVLALIEGMALKSIWDFRGRERLNVFVGARTVPYQTFEGRAEIKRGLLGLCVDAHGTRTNKRV